MFTLRLPPRRLVSGIRSYPMRLPSLIRRNIVSTRRNFCAHRCGMFLLPSAVVANFYSYSLADAPACQVVAPVVKVETGLTTETFFQKVMGYLRKLYKYLLVTGRILFCTVVIVPSSLAVPVFYLLKREEQLWDLLIYVIEFLGPTFIKMGQWAGTRPDLFPSAFTSRLITLQDSTTTHPWSVAEKTLCEAFGEDWESKLDIIKSPIGSGCIAQVYKGTLRSTGEKIAVKLIHPHIEETVNLDMIILRGVVWFLELMPSMKYMSLSSSVEQFANSMQNQMDLTLEAANLIRFQKDFFESAVLEFPSPVNGFIKRHALVEKFMDGVPIMNFMGPEVDKELKLKLSFLACNLLLEMVFIHNFVHGDLHPGNILVKMTPEGPKLIFLDCGIVTTVTEKDHKTFIDICLALLNFNGREAAKHMLSHRKLDDSGPSFEGFAAGIQKIVQKARDENAFEHIGEYITTICNLSCQYRVALIPEVINVAMAIKVCEGISLNLNPELELAKVAIPTVLKGQAKYMVNQAKKKFSMKRPS